MSKLDEVQEIRQLGPQLLSASKLIGKYCDEINDQFILCKAQNDNPLNCFEIGKEVTKCSRFVFDKITESCYKEWMAHSECLNKGNLEFKNCREPKSNTEQLFLNCLKKHNI